MIRAIICAIIVILISPKSAMAGNPPQLTSPSDGSTVSSSTLNWQAPSYQLYSTNPYRVQVDDDPSFSPSASIYRDTYKTNTTYTPELTPGTWYWRVKARDSSDTWSDWSSTWSFILSTSTPEPTSSASTPSPSPSSSSSSSSSSSFLISGTPSQVTSDQSFSVSVNLSLPDNPSTTFYLKGAFKKADSSNYFGYTKVSGSWVKNGSSYSSQLPLTTDSSGNWTGNLSVQPDAEDSGFIGTDDYIFKVGRYTSSGSGPTWSNEVTLKIIGNPVSDSSSTSNSSNTSKASTSPTSSPKSSSKTTSITTSKSTKSSKIASVAGEATISAENSATPSASPEANSGKQLNFLPWIGGIFILAGISSLIFIYLRAKHSQ